MATIRDFVGRATTLLTEEADRLRGRTPGAAATSARAAEGTTTISSAPLGHLQEGRLDFTRGAAMVTIGACDDELLYRARFPRATRVSVEGGQVTVLQRRAWPDSSAASPASCC